MKNSGEHLTWAEVDLKAIEHNLQEIRRLSLRNQFVISTRKKSKQPIEILTVIKADAYGHGMDRVGCLLNKLGVNYFAVSDVCEGIELRKVGIKKPILLLESTLPELAKKIVDHDLMPTVCTMELAHALNRYAQKIKRHIHIHIKVDTGMGRLGIWHEEAFDFIQNIFKLRYLTVQGIYTHFPSADTDKKFTLGQIKSLYDLVLRLDRSGLIIPYIHASNSMGLAGYETKVLNLVRPGLMIYGLYPDAQLKKKVNLHPALSVKSKVIFVKELKKGRSVSYGRTFIAKKNITVATIPVGYSDGYLRGLSNKASVLIDGKRCPVIGRVTMDQIVVDVSAIKKVKLGMPVVILGSQGRECISADELANHSATINYEIVCNLGNRLPRIYI